MVICKYSQILWYHSKSNDITSVFCMGQNWAPQSLDGEFRSHILKSVVPYGLTLDPSPYEHVRKNEHVQRDFPVHLVHTMPTVLARNSYKSVNQPIYALISPFITIYHKNVRLFHHLEWQSQLWVVAVYNHLLLLLLLPLMIAFRAFECRTSCWVEAACREPPESCHHANNMHMV